jgi:hypothetical protein
MSTPASPSGIVHWHVVQPITVPLRSRLGMTMVPVGMLDRMGVAAVDVSVDVSASEALSADMDVEEEGGSEVDVMLES